MLTTRHDSILIRYNYICRVSQNISHFSQLFCLTSNIISKKESRKCWFLVPKSTRNGVTQKKIFKKVYFNFLSIIFFFFRLKKNKYQPITGHHMSSGPANSAKIH